MDKTPEERDARRAFLQGWGQAQQGRLAAEDQRLARNEQGRLYAEEIARVVAEARQRVGQADSLQAWGAIPVVVTRPSELPVDRAAVFDDLMLRLRECEWADPIVSECDEPRYIAPTAIDLARRHRPDAPWLLNMEDDVILGPDFGLLPGLLREADALFPDAGIVSFFSGWFRDPGWLTHPIEHFAWTQCFAIRNTDYLVGFRAFIDSVVTQRRGPKPAIIDQQLRAFLAVEYAVFALWCPSLVQHAAVASLLIDPAGDASERISWSYEQAYG